MHRNYNSLLKSTPCSAAASEEIEKNKYKGEYFVPYCQKAEPNMNAKNPELIEKTWVWTREVLRKHFDPDWDYSI
jgi:hypothetical protein